MPVQLGEDAAAAEERTAAVVAVISGDVQALSEFRPQVVDHVAHYYTVDKSHGLLNEQELPLSNFITALAILTRGGSSVAVNHLTEGL